MGNVKTSQSGIASGTTAPKKGGILPSLDTDLPDTIARWFLVVVISGIVWRLLRYFLNFEMSIDESYIMNNVIPRSYAELLDPLNYSQVSPPAFLWVTKVFDSWFRDEWGVRLVPFLAGLAGVAVFWGICAEVLRGAARWVAWAIFTVSYVPVAQCTCAKGYTIDLLSAMLMLWLMLRWLGRGRRTRELIWLGLLAPIFVWFSYTSVFVIGAISLIFIAYVISEREARNCRNMVAGVAFMALAGGSAIWLYEVNIRPSLPVSHDSGLQEFWSKGYPPLEHPWRIPLWLLEVHTGRGFAWPVGENNFGSTLTTVLWVTGLVVFWRRGNKWIWALFIAPHILSLAASFLHKYPYGANPRICMFLGPGICLFMGVGVQYWLERLGHVQERRNYRVVAAVLLIVAMGGITRDVVVKIRELRTPGIRSALVDAGRRVGMDGRFVVLNSAVGATNHDATLQVVTYYLSRYITQPAWQKGEINPSELHPGSDLAVLTIVTGPGGLEPDPFETFEKRLGKTITPTWTGIASIHTRSKERLVVRTYRVGA